MDFIMWEFLFCGDDIKLHYRWAVRRAKKLSDKLANPINQRTAKPLSPLTLKRYQRERDKRTQEISRLKQAIAILSQCRLIGPKSDEDCPENALFLRSIIESLFETTKENKELHSQIVEKNSSIKTLNKSNAWLMDQCEWWMGQSKWWMERCGKQFGHSPSKKGKRGDSARVFPFELIQGGKQGAHRSVPRGPFSQPRQ